MVNTIYDVSIYNTKWWYGYSDAEMDYFKEFVRNNAHLMIEFSKEGGILNTSNF